MIVSRTPLRISFAGGGTDLKAFYEIEPGAVVGTTINKCAEKISGEQSQN